MSIKITDIKKVTINQVIAKLKEENTYECLNRLKPHELKFLAYVTLKTLKAVTSATENKELTIKQKDFYKHIISIATCIKDPKEKYKPVVGKK